MSLEDLLPRHLLYTPESHRWLEMMAWWQRFKALCELIHPKIDPWYDVVYPLSQCGSKPWFQVTSFAGAYPSVLSPCGPVLSVSFSPDDQKLATAGVRQGVNIWDVRRGQNIVPPPFRLLRSFGRSFSGQNETVQMVRYNKDAKLVSASLASGVRMYDMQRQDPAQWTRIPRLPESDVPTLCASFSPNGTRVIAGTIENALKIWDLVITPGSPPSGISVSLDPEDLLTPSKTYLAAEFLSDGVSFIYGKDDAYGIFSEVCKLSVGEQQPLVATAHNFHRVAARVLDRRAAFHVGSYNECTFEAAVSGQIPRGEQFLSLAFAPASRILAAGCSDGVIRLYDYSLINPDVRLEPFKTITTGRGRINGVAFSWRGDLLATGYDEFPVDIWDVQSQQRVLNVGTCVRTVLRPAVSEFDFESDIPRPDPGPLPPPNPRRRLKRTAKDKKTKARTHRAST